ncbi:hypothetical protein AKJ09_11175 [Labilithrix luteola]|uniref:Uncharacterized protein n=2 Tax=Labilithrix luteola TaxID=1391654 RepID=A0A0K1QFS5_9BACT|nr:hypothetical protein AKJ09_11175 [Labilithrix luteola]
MRGQLRSTDRAGRVTPHATEQAEKARAPRRGASTRTHRPDDLLRVRATRALRILVAHGSLVAVGPVPMARTLSREAIVEPLLNSLEVERHVRGPLLMSVIAELSANERLAPAFDLAASMLMTLDAGGLGEADFARQLIELRALVRKLSPRRSTRRPSGGVRVVARPTAPALGSPVTVARAARSVARVP